MNKRQPINAEKDLIRIMSSNILAVQSDSETIIPKRIRATSMCAHYLTYQPDLLGLQEVQVDVKELMVSLLSDVYTMVNADTAGGKNYTPISQEP